VALLQHPVMVCLLLLLCFFVAPLCWVVSGVGLLVNSFMQDTCNMMKMHIAGEPNQWVLDKLGCNTLKNSFSSASVLMSASNAQTADANEAIDRVLFLHDHHMSICASMHAEVMDCQ
jgi:hypothetical protein